MLFDNVSIKFFANNLKHGLAKAISIIQAR